jgi:hypothetical protein
MPLYDPDTENPGQCKCCRAWFTRRTPGDEASSRDLERPEYCAGCAYGLFDPEARRQPVAAVRTNESHDPNDWTFV